MFRQPGYSTDNYSPEPTPRPDWVLLPPESVTKVESDAKAWRSFWRGTIFGAAVVAALGYSLPAFADPLSISGTMVMLEPMEAPAVAVVTMQNVNVNGPTDNGVYALGMEGLALEVVFSWEVEEGGADSLLILPPDGMICLPADCLMVVEEGQSGRVVILEFLGS